MKRIHIYISGQVQGVFFRAYTKEKAEKLGLAGWVKNLPNGRVEAVFEGDSDQIDQMIAWCHQGSPGSKVKKVEVVEEIPQLPFSSHRNKHVRDDSTGLKSLPVESSRGAEKKLKRFEIRR